MDLKLFEVLHELGYDLRQRNNYYQTNAVYRNGDNKTAIVIYPSSNLVIDFVEGRSFSIEKLIGLTLKIEDDEKIKEWLSNKNIVITTPKEIPKIKMSETFSKDNLEMLAQDHSYWIGRGIDSEVIKLFKGGVSIVEGKLKDRYVFPIFNGKGEIIGFTGRDIKNYKCTYPKFARPKWKHIGNKTEWKWPLYLNHEEVKRKSEAILVESPGDLLSLYTSGIKNGICLFGLECSLAILNFLIKYDINKIIISTNNDSDKSSAGNNAAEKIYSRLSRYFDSRQLKICLPPFGDWNEVLLKNGEDGIMDWYKKL